ncbi:MAG: hypothetical protein QXO55_06180 [Candidatus Korarchaeum sp.]
MRRMDLVVMGPHQSGKSTFIRRIDPLSFRMDYSRGSISTTIGFDYGTVYWSFSRGRIYRKDQIDEINPIEEVWKVTLTGTPGQMSFSHVRRTLIKGKDGVILVVDSTVPGSLVYAISHYLEARDVLGDLFPIAVLFNKQDLPNARDPTLLLPLLSIKASLTYGISALTGYNVERAMLSFLELVRRHLFSKSILRVVQ